MLAVVFFFALVIEPEPNNPYVAYSLLLIGSYMLLSYALMLLAWHSWWYDEHLAPLMLVVDVAVFLVSVFLTESFRTDFTSPFLALYALIVLSATMRWDWQFAARTGVIVALIFVTVGMAIVASSDAFDLFSFARRSFYMVGLLLVLVWFGVQRREPQPPPLELPPDPLGEEALLWNALDYALALAGGSTAALAWSAHEEPWFELRVQTAHGGGPRGSVPMNCPAGSRRWMRSASSTAPRAANWCTIANGASARRPCAIRCRLLTNWASPKACASRSAPWAAKA